jgi:hypothetical protein
MVKITHLVSRKYGVITDAKFHAEIDKSGVVILLGNGKYMSLKAGEYRIINNE